MEIKVLSPDGKIYEGKTDFITLPGQKGQFQILENHAPIFALLNKGKVILNHKSIPISFGILHFSQNKAFILVKE